MALKTRFDPVEKVTTAEILAALQEPEAKQAAADFAQEGIDEAKQINQSIFGRVPPYTVTVDGKQGAPLNTVNPDGGTIIVEFDLAFDAIAWIAKTLLERSPVDSGEYKRSHMLLADGQETTMGGNIPPAQEYTFINPVPYARKIEIGKTKKGRSFVIQVENRIYERVAQDARAKFGNLVDIKFGYRQPTGAYTLKRDTRTAHWKIGARGRSGLSKMHRAGAAVLSPSIIVYMKRR